MAKVKTFLIIYGLKSFRFDHFQLNCENRKLKYLSLSSRPCLDELLPSISDCISLEEETEQQDPSSDPFSQYKLQVKGKYHSTSVLKWGAVYK